MIGRMPQYAPDNIDDVRLALRGLSHRMEVEVETGIPLAAALFQVNRIRVRGVCTWPLPFHAGIAVFPLRVNVRECAQLPAFAHVADYDLQFGKAVENAAEDEANDGNRSYDVPAQSVPASICVTSGAKPLYDAKAGQKITA
jgi:hypothetical protein